jgi:hypothetical protein
MKRATKLDTRRMLLRALGLAFCVIPVTVSILCYFPAWKAEGGEVLLSGVSVLLLALAALPLYKLISIRLRSPAAYTVWLIAFVLFSLLSRIADEMAVISFTGLIGNLIGAVIYKLADGGKNEGS